jgi:hypothetical protein
MLLCRGSEVRRAPLRWKHYGMTAEHLDAHQSAAAIARRIIKTLRVTEQKPLCLHASECSIEIWKSIVRTQQEPPHVLSRLTASRLQSTLGRTIYWANEPSLPSPRPDRSCPRQLGKHWLSATHPTSAFLHIMAQQQHLLSIATVYIF